MTPEQKRALAGLLRRYVEMLADKRLLVTILREAQQGHRPPYEWEKDVQRLRQTREYRAVLEKSEPMVVRLEQAAELDDLIPLLQKMSEGKLPN